MLNPVEILFYVLVILIFLHMIIRTIFSKRWLKSNQEIYMVVENSNSLMTIFNNKIFVNVSFLIVMVAMGAYAISKRMYIENMSSLVSVWFCIGLAYFEWYSCQQKMIITKNGINIGVDYVNWENVDGYVWKEDGSGEGVSLRIRRKNKIPFSFRVNQKDKKKLDQMVSSKMLKD